MSTPPAAAADPGRPSSRGHPVTHPGTALAVVVAAIALEALALVGVAVFSAVELVVDGAREPVGAVATAVLALLLGVALAACGRALLRGRRWSRAPVMTWQLLQLLGVALPLLRDPSGRWIGVVLAALALVVAVGLLLPSVVARTAGRDDPPVG